MLPGQRCLLVTVGSVVVSLDWVLRPRAWARLRDGVVRGHTLPATDATEIDEAVACSSSLGPPVRRSASGCRYRRERMCGWK